MPKSDDWKAGYAQGAHDALTYIRGVADGYLIEFPFGDAKNLNERIVKASEEWAKRDHAPLGHE